jgi:hypothetical protein
MESQEGVMSEENPRLEVPAVAIKLPDGSIRLCTLDSISNLAKMSVELCRRLECQAALAGDSEGELFWKDRKASFGFLVPDEVQAAGSTAVERIVGASGPGTVPPTEEGRMIDEIVRAAFRLGASCQSEALALWLNRLCGEDLGFEFVTVPSARYQEITRTLSEQELSALDWRDFVQSIVLEVGRVNSQHVDVSVIRDAKHEAESKLRYFTRLLELAAPLEKPAVEATITRQRALLNLWTAELEAREEAVRIQTGRPEAQEPVDSHNTPKARHIDDQKGMVVSQIPVTAEASPSDTQPSDRARSRRGRPSKLEKHMQVADMVAQLGVDWKDGVNLKRLAEWMDSSEIPVDSRFHKKRVYTWIDKLDIDQVNFIKAIEHRLKLAKN